jgi:hypothetical protein
MVEEANRVLDLERQALRVVCQGTPEGPVRSVADSTLSNYRWLEPVHRVTFEILLAFGTTSVLLIREHFPARLARRGFPDFDFGFLFEPHSLSRGEAERLMRELVSLAESRDQAAARHSKPAPNAYNQN